MNKILLGLSLFAVSSLQASITPTLVAGSPTGPVGGPYTWTYNVDLASDQNVVSGVAPGVSTPSGVERTSTDQADYFTIYDFAGYTGVHSEPAGWMLQIAPIGSTPSDTLPADGSNVNLTWYYATGPVIVGSSSADDLGNFTAQSIYSRIRGDNYTSSATKNDGVFAGTTVSSIGTVAVPNEIPEPATMSLMGGALLGLGMLARRRK